MDPLVITSWYHWARRQWKIFRAWRELRAKHRTQQMIQLMPMEQGFIRSRPLSQRDVVECCTWVLERCPKSIRARPGTTYAVALSERTEATARINHALAEGRSMDEDWAITPLRFVLEDASERTLFKLTWG